jgi:hypothetical protein
MAVPTDWDKWRAAQEVWRKRLNKLAGQDNGSDLCFGEGEGRRWYITNKYPTPASFPTPPSLPTTPATPSPEERRHQTSRLINFEASSLALTCVTLIRTGINLRAAPERFPA